MQFENLSKLTGRPTEVRPLPLVGRYPRALLVRELIKAGAGLAVCLGIILLLHPSPYLAWPLGGIGVMFAVYLSQQLLRYPLCVEMDENGVTRVMGRWRREMPWRKLDKFRLSYYPHGRKASTGTLVLTLSAGGRRLKVDSGLENFPTLLQTSARAAQEQGLTLNPTTVDNLAQLGLP